MADRLARDADSDDGTDTVIAKRELNDAREELATLYAALDHVHSGLLILDAKLHARYSNPALHQMFKVFDAEQIRNERPFYGDMLQAAANASAVDLENYVARRLEWVAAGGAAATDLNMSNGTVLRCQLARLPGGGRMLIYSDVTDIVRAAQELERLATIDGMTGIYNRRHFLALADREWNCARRHGRPLSFLMIDIDHFKAINDRFGHSAGDRVLRDVAEALRAHLREADLVTRYGGEEFVAVVSGIASERQALAVAEKLRAMIEQMPAAPELRVTISIGVALSDPAASAMSLIERADRALYEAKRQGRNRVTPYSALNERNEVVWDQFGP
jgi:diguanylate cyclase (GGDEF)-like protein